ncbi:MAG: hypothetical protein GKR99_09035 [Rhodobacteraceae bacterium]|nr:hypothetical protein [Paracoccaceae bacterium]
MAYVSHTAPFGSVIGATYGKVANALGRAFTIMMNSRDRTHIVRLLQAKSDADLARIGIQRDRIVHHVYRDLINI